jgi:predicted RNase H-like HicB family nuclease
MQYPVLIEQKNGAYHAVIPALANLSAEGDSAVEALQKVQQAAQEFLASVTVASVELPSVEDQTLRPGSPQSVLKALEVFRGDEEALREHFAEIAAEREQERDALEQLQAA